MATTLKARVRTMLPAVLKNGVGIAVTKIGLIYQVAMDWSQLNLLLAYDPSAQRILTQSTIDNSFGLVTMTQLLTASQTSQIKTSAGDVNAANTDGLIAINKTVGAATNVNLPLSTSKVGDLLIVDYKGDSDVNPITINCSGAEKFNGGLASWVIQAPGAAVIVKPISGSGYALK